MTFMKQIARKVALKLDIFYNPAGQNGWLVDVIGAYEPHTDDVIYWGTDGIGLAHDNDIVEVLE